MYHYINRMYHTCSFTYLFRLYIPTEIVHGEHLLFLSSYRSCLWWASPAPLFLLKLSMVSISCSSPSSCQPRFSNYAMTTRQLKTTWIKWPWHQSNDSCSLTNINPNTLGSILFIYLRSISVFFSNNWFTALLSFACFIISLVIYTCFLKNIFLQKVLRAKSKNFSLF